MKDYEQRFSEKPNLSLDKYLKSAASAQEVTEPCALAETVHSSLRFPVFPSLPGKQLRVVVVHSHIRKPLKRKKRPIGRNGSLCTTALGKEAC